MSANEVLPLAVFRAPISGLTFLTLRAALIKPTPIRATAPAKERTTALVNQIT